MRWVLGWSRNPDNKFVEYKAAGHGTDMFAVEKNLEPMVLDWFNAHLRNAPEKPAAVVASKPSPTEEFWNTLSAPGGVAKARQMYDDAKRAGKPAVLFPENETNLLGYQLLQEGNAKDAVEVFKLNVDAYPASANTYDSLSDGYLALGNKEEALRYAEQGDRDAGEGCGGARQSEDAGAGERGEEDQGTAKAVTLSKGAKAVTLSKERTVTQRPSPYVSRGARATPSDRSGACSATTG